MPMNVPYSVTPYTTPYIEKEIVDIPYCTNVLLTIFQG